MSNSKPVMDGIQRCEERVPQSMVDTVRLGDETTRVVKRPTVVPHQFEHEIQRQLLSQPELEFSSLVVRRTQNGVCLEGTLKTGKAAPDICAIVRQVAGVTEVLNHLVVHQADMI